MDESTRHVDIHPDLERLAEACERAAQELSVKCLRCWEYPESMSLCDYC